MKSRCEWTADKSEQAGQWLACHLVHIITLNTAADKWSAALVSDAALCAEPHRTYWTVGASATSEVSELFM